jgi:hypothetical protein
MNWGAIIKALPSLLSLIATLVGRRKEPAKRVEEILGGPETPTNSQKAKEAADAAADAKFGA